MQLFTDPQLRRAYIFFLSNDFHKKNHVPMRVALSVHPSRSVSLRTGSDILKLK